MADNENQVPDKDPGDDDSLAGMLRGVFKKQAQGMEGQLPATVVSYDRTTNLATIRPSIDMMTTGGQRVTRASLASIPVLALGGGGYCVTFPLKPGDTGWIEASDRDVSLWLQGAGKSAAQPNSERLHSFADGRFIPDALAAYKIPADADKNADMVIQSYDGTVFIALKPDEILIKAPKVTIDAGATTIKGGTLDVTSVTTLEGIRWKPHVHGGIQPGGSTTAPPQ